MVALIVWPHLDLSIGAGATLGIITEATLTASHRLHCLHLHVSILTNILLHTVRQGTRTQASVKAEQFLER